ncbi:hypothetical protein ACFFRR_008546 [Megaselia abdita]
MNFNFGIILTLWSLLVNCLALPDIHKRMTDDQLFSVFNVEHIDAVPKYEIVQLLHQGTKHSHHLARRSIQHLEDVPAKSAHHIKKDLSKSPYYSELKLQSQPQKGNSISDQSYSDKLKNLDLRHIREHNVTISAFGENLNLTLKAADGLFKNGPNSLKVWTVSNEPNSTHGLEYDEVEHENDEHIGEIFQDETNMAAILMRRHLETGDLVMEGSIGHDIVIKPLPHELSPNKDGAHHVVFKRDVDSLEHESDFAYMEPDNIEAFNRREKRTPEASKLEQPASLLDELSEDDDSVPSESNKRKKRAAPYMIYPEILVIVDYDGYRLHGGDNLQVKRYFVSFWNGVDLRYRLLKGPRIRISIAGIIISRGRDATPYLERNRVGRDAIDSAAALTDMGKYLFRERRLPVYDIAVAITKYDMCRRRKGGRCTKGTAGFAYVGGACVVNKRLEKVNSVAIIEDTGGFSGIIVAAHEVGHLLGAVHDGSPPPSYLGGPGAEHCRWEDGYIMSDLRHTERGFRWSPCTVQSFHHFLNGDTATCLHNPPHEDSALGRNLPGTLLTLDAQCRRDRGTYACFKDERVCAQLFCFDAQTGYCVAYRPAAEGSPCGTGQHCLDGRCVAQISNVIGDYVPQYRAFYSSTTVQPKLDSSENNTEEDEDDILGEIDEETTRRSSFLSKRSTTTPSDHSSASSTTKVPVSSTATSSLSTTSNRSSFFDEYFKKLVSSTKSPYLDNIGHLFRSKYHTSFHKTNSKTNNTTQPPYTFNFLGDHSNNSPVVKVTSSSTRSRSE